MEVVHVDVLDRLDPGRLQRGGAADDGEIGTAEVAKRGERAGPMPPLPTMIRTPSRSISGRVKRSIRIRGGGADAERLVAGGPVR